MNRQLFFGVLVAAVTLVCLVSPAIGQQSSGALYPMFLGVRQFPHYEYRYDAAVYNTGDAPLTGVLVTQATLYPGWLGTDTGYVSVLPGESQSFQIIANVGGQYPPPGILVEQLEGVVLVIVDQPTATDTLGMVVRVTLYDREVFPPIDTVSTGCVQLVARPDGNLGNACVGGANMNFFDDCDTLPDIPGEARTYLYEASPLCVTADTRLSASIYNGGVPGWYPGFTLPLHDDPPAGRLNTDPSIYEAYFSGRFLTNDHALTLTQTVAAPKAPEVFNTMILALTLTSTDGLAYDDITLGYAFDWDVPSDSNLDNRSGADQTNQIVWQRGREVNEPMGDALECQQNDARWAGVGLIGWTDGTHPFSTESVPYGGYVGRVAEDITPTGGFREDDLYAAMQSHVGLSAQPSSVVEDLYTVLTIFNSYDLADNDTLIVWLAIATVENGTEMDLVSAINGARDWFSAVGPPIILPPCCDQLGDVNNDGRVNLTDVTRMVNCMFITFDCNLCLDAMDMNHDGFQTLTDLTIFINYLFVSPGQNPPGECYGTTGL